MSFLLPKSMDRPNKKAPPRRVDPGSIIAVASGKGGVGKTFMSISLASAFAQAGQRTLLVDCDLGLPNVDVQLGIAPETDLAAVVAGWVELEDAVYPIDGGPSQNGFDVLPGRSGSGTLAELASDEVGRLAAGITALSLQYDRVILDLGAGVEANCMRLTRTADTALIVITDDPASMTDGYAFIKILRGYAPNVEASIAVNHAKDRKAGQRTYEGVARACSTFLGIRPQLSGIVVRDEKVREANIAQRTLFTCDPNCQPVLDVIAISQTMLGKRQKTNMLF